MGTDCTAISIGEVADDKLAELGKQGVSRVLHANAAQLKDFTSSAYATTVAQAMDKASAKVLVLAHTGKRSIYGQPPGREAAGKPRYQCH